MTAPLTLRITLSSDYILASYGLGNIYDQFFRRRDISFAWYSVPKRFDLWIGAAQAVQHGNLYLLSYIFCWNAFAFGDFLDGVFRHNPFCCLAPALFLIHSYTLTNIIFLVRPAYQTILRVMKAASPAAYQFAASPLAVLRPSLYASY